MTHQEKLQIFKDQYQKNFDQALSNGDRKKGKEILKEWREYCKGQEVNAV